MMEEPLPQLALGRSAFPPRPAPAPPASGSGSQTSRVRIGAGLVGHSGGSYRSRSGTPRTDGSKRSAESARSGRRKEAALESAGRSTADGLDDASRPTTSATIGFGECGVGPVDDQPWVSSDGCPPSLLLDLEDVPSKVDRTRPNTVGSWPHGASLRSRSRSQGGSRGSSSSEPSLMKKINAFLAKELGLIRIQGREVGPGGVPSREVLSVYKQAAAMFADSFEAYKGAFEPMIMAYDSHLDYLSTQCERLPGLEGELEMLKANRTAQGGEIAHKFSVELHQMKLKVGELESRAEEATRSADISKRDVSDCKRHIEQLEKDKKEDYERVLMLISAVKDAEHRHKETHAKLIKAQLDNEKVQELAELYQGSQKELNQAQVDLSQNVPKSIHNQALVKLEEAQHRVGQLLQEKLKAKKTQQMAVQEIDRLTTRNTQLLAELESKDKIVNSKDWEQWCIGIRCISTGQFSTMTCLEREESLFSALRNIEREKQAVANDLKEFRARFGLDGLDEGGSPPMGNTGRRKTRFYPKR